MVPDPDGMGSRPQPLLCAGAAFEPAALAPAAVPAEPVIPLDPSEGGGWLVPAAPAPACPTPAGGLGLPMETAPARPPEFAPLAPSGDAVPPVPDCMAAAPAAVGAPTVGLRLLLATGSGVQAHSVQPNVTTMHRVARLVVFSLNIANCISRRGLVFCARPDCTKKSPVAGNSRCANRLAFTSSTITEIDPHASSHATASMAEPLAARLHRCLLG